MIGIDPAEFAAESGGRPLVATVLHGPGQLCKCQPRQEVLRAAEARGQVNKADGSRLLAADTGLGRQQQGAVSLVHLPARFSRTQHFLAGLALAEVARTMQRTGDEGAAARLSSELHRTYPNHPLHESGEADSP